MRDFTSGNAEFGDVALTRGGYRVLSAGSGAEALTLWNTHGRDVDLLFTDLVMPDGISGLQLAALLLERRPGLKVLFTSGYSTDFVGGERPLHEGVNFLQKPYTLVNLATTVRARLDAT